jgi:hypothetical protein
MKSAKIICTLVTIVSSTNSFALLCPGNFNEINVGDKLAQVKSACGAPTSETTSESEANTPQEWNYYVAVNSAFYQNVSQGTQATLKTTVAFNNGKVTNMSVNGVGVSSTAVCGNNIQVGDTENAVKAACGKPAFINRGTGSQQGTQGGNATPIQVTELTYNVGGVITVLVFENGIFKQRKSQ